MTIRENFHCILEKLLEAVQAVYADRLIALLIYGSVGRGRPRPDSDIDVLLVADDLPCGRLARVREFDEVERRLEPMLRDLSKEGISTSLSPVFKTREEVLRGSLLFLDMIDDAVILYDGDGFMKSYLDRLAQRLVELGAKKVVRGNSWHWVLKPDYREGEVFEI